MQDNLQGGSMPSLQPSHAIFAIAIVGVTIYLGLVATKSVDAGSQGASYTLEDFYRFCIALAVFVGCAMNNARQRDA